MAKIKLITGLNVKGYDFTYQLGSVNMIVGNNGTGKTARLAALRLAILGHEPKLGTQGASTYQLAGATKNEMRVSMQTEIGNSDKKWTMKGGKVSASETLDDTFARAIQGVPTVMLDSREFFGLKTSDSRSKFIFSTYKIGDGATSPTSLITKLKAITLEGQTDAHTEALQEIVDKVMDSARNRSRAVKEDQDYPLQQWLTEQHATVKEIGTVAKGTYTRMVQSVEATTQHQGAEQQAVFRPIETLKDELAKLQTFGEQLAGELRELLKRQESAAAKVARRLELTQALKNCPAVTSEDADRAVDDLKKARAEFDEHSLLIGRLASEADALAKQIKADTDNERTRTEIKSELTTLRFDQGAYDQAGQEISKLESAVEYRSKTPELRAQMENNTIAFQRANSETNALMGEMVSLKSKSDAVLDHDACPICTLTGSAWKEAYAQATENTLNELRGKHKWANDTMEALNDVAEKLKVELKESESADAVHVKNREKLLLLRKSRALLEEAKSRVTTLTAKLEAIPASQLKALEEKHTALNASMKEALAKKADLSDRITRHGETIGNWSVGKSTRDRLDEIGEDALVDYPALIQAVRTKQDERMSKNRSIEAELQKATEAQQDELRKAQSNAEMEKAKARSEIAREALKVIQEFQKEVVDGVFATLIGRANSIVGNLLPAPLEYREGQIGWQRGNLFVTEKTFCGLEEVMTFVAFSLALSPDSPFKIIILDEMGMLSKVNRVHLVAQMGVLAKHGVIDQFVGADCDEDLYGALEGVNVIKTS